MSEPQEPLKSEPELEEKPDREPERASDAADKPADPAPEGASVSADALTGSSTEPKPAAAFPTMAVAAAALLGAALAIGVQFALSTSGVLTASGEGRELASRLERVETEMRVRAPQAEDLAALLSAVATMRQRLATLDARGVGDAGAVTAQVAELGNSLRAFNRQLTELQTRTQSLEAITPADLGARLDALVTAADFAALAVRVDQLEANDLANDMRRAALALGLAQLSRSTQGSDPFMVELNAVTAMRPDDAVVAQLRGAAETGVPTLAMLVADFEPLARSVVQAGGAIEGGSQWQQVRAWLVQFFALRRTAELEGDTVDAILARAELRLAEGNLSAAVEEMASLPEQSRAPAEDWIAAAQARVAVDRLITSLSTEIIGELEQ